MNRWFGTQQDSDRQASQRSNRAARRAINKLDLHLVLSDDDNFEDANTSFSTHLNIDGEPGEEGAEDSSSSSSSSTPVVAPVAMAAFEDANAEDHEKAWEK